MPIIDILIAVALIISVIVGVIRGFIKEAISITALLTAIWAALYFGPGVGEVSESFISSREMQAWFGRILVFAIVLSLGGLIGWGISKLVRLSVLSGIDRFLGALFGFARGILLAAIFILAGQSNMVGHAKAHTIATLYKSAENKDKELLKLILLMGLSLYPTVVGT